MTGPSFSAAWSGQPGPFPLAAAAFADDHIGPVPVVLGLGDAHGSLEVLVGQGRVEDGVAVPGQVGRFDPARDGLPAVEEEDFHARRVRQVASCLAREISIVSGSFSTPACRSILMT